MKKFSKIFILTITLLTTTCKWTPEALAEKTTNTTLFIDPDNYITQAQTKIIENNLKSLKEATNYDIRLYVIDEMGGMYYYIETFVNDLTYYVLNKDEEKDKNSLFILFSIKDRKMRIRTGEMARKILTDNICVYYLDSLKTLLKAEQYGDAIIDLIAKVHNRLINPSVWESFYVSFFETYFETICIYLIVILFFYIFSNKSLDKSAEDKLKRIKEICEKDKSKKHFIESSCIICLEEFEKETNIELNELKVENTGNGNNAIKEDTQHNEYPKEEAKEYPEEESKEYKDESKAKDDLFGEHCKSKQQNSVFKATLECGHTFHSSCISDWMTKQNKCPICREKIDKEEDNTKPLAEDLITVHTSYHPSFSSLRFDYTNDSLAWRMKNSGRSSSSSWGSRSGGGSSGW
jgi:uncharacterized membrane protein YgcG